MAEPEQTHWQYDTAFRTPTLLDPTTWALDQIGLGRPGNRDIQVDLMYDDRTNLPMYPELQAFFWSYQPPTLIVWGRNDYVCPPEGATPYSRDLTNSETHLLDTGHFALKTHAEEIASFIVGFLTQNKITRSAETSRTLAGWQ
jgi:pimeloyl-ACP methyl ester carboxylesterase